MEKKLSGGDWQRGVREGGEEMEKGVISSGD